MFDPRDFASDPRTPGPRTKDKRREARRNHTKEREGLDRNGHRRQYDPRGTKRQTFQHRTDQAIADVGMCRPQDGSLLRLGDAVFLVGLLEGFGDLRRVMAFDFVPVEHIDGLAGPKECGGRRRGR